MLDEAQRDQNEQARPELANHVEDMEDYDTIILGYPNWWASIPMPIASFLEEYDFTGKTIIPFCSHGGGSLMKSILNIAVPNGIENGIFQLVKVALSSIVALFGTYQIAANGVAQSFWSQQHGIF